MPTLGTKLLIDLLCIAPKRRYQVDPQATASVDLRGVEHRPLTVHDIATSDTPDYVDS
jgi:hypothetical protein